MLAPISAIDVARRRLTRSSVCLALVVLTSLRSDHGPRTKPTAFTRPLPDAESIAEAARRTARQIRLGTRCGQSWPCFFHHSVASRLLTPVYDTRVPIAHACAYYVAPCRVRRFRNAVRLGVAHVGAKHYTESMMLNVYRAYYSMVQVAMLIQLHESAASFLCERAISYSYTPPRLHCLHIYVALPHRLHA